MLQSDTTRHGGRGKPKGITLRILREPQVVKIAGISRASIWRRVKAGDFPAPFRLGGGNAIGWKSDEIDEWLEGLQRAVTPEPKSFKVVTETVTVQDERTFTIVTEDVTPPEPKTFKVVTETV